MKKIDYDLWSECAELIQSKEHLQEKGLNRILSIKSVLNKGLSGKLKAVFCNNNRYTWRLSIFH